MEEDEEDEKEEDLCAELSWLREILEFVESKEVEDMASV